jgi:hypothetical protein
VDECQNEDRAVRQHRARDHHVEARSIADVRAREREAACDQRAEDEDRRSAVSALGDVGGAQPKQAERHHGEHAGGKGHDQVEQDVLPVIANIAGREGSQHNGVDGEHAYECEAADPCCAAAPHLRFQ